MIGKRVGHSQFSTVIFYEKYSVIAFGINFKVLFFKVFYFFHCGSTEQLFSSGFYVIIDSSHYLIINY